MTILSKEKVSQILYEIFELTTAEELHKKAQDISLSGIDNKSRKFLNKAINTKLEGLVTVNALSVNGEICSGDLDD